MSERSRRGLPLHKHTAEGSGQAWRRAAIVALPGGARNNGRDLRKIGGSPLREDARNAQAKSAG